MINVNLYPTTRLNMQILSVITGLIFEYLTSVGFYMSSFLLVVSMQIIFFTFDIDKKHFKVVKKYSLKKEFSQT